MCEITRGLVFVAFVGHFVIVFRNFELLSGLDSPQPVVVSLERNKFITWSFEPDSGTTMAEGLKKQRKIRVDHRAHVKKLLTQIEDSISNFEPSLQDQLSQQKILLREKLDTLKNLDNKILKLIDDEDGDNAIVNEVTEASEITDEITWAMVRIDSTLTSLQINSPPISTSSALTGRPHS